jgi:hypothetical protein
MTRPIELRFKVSPDLLDEFLSWSKDPLFVKMELVTDDPKRLVPADGDEVQFIFQKPMPH